MRIRLLAFATLMTLAGSASAHTTTTSQWDPATGRMVEVKHWSLFAPSRPSAFTQRHWITRKVHKLIH